jgi:hypothetical protein
MIKIKLYELDKHRNECTFRPFLYAQNSLRDIGIEFTTGNSYDYAWIAQASFTTKNVSLEQSVENGLEFLSKISGDYMLIDGQDSTSLLGTYEVFKSSNALIMLKNSLLKDRSLYKHGWQMGRYYWGPGEYKLEDFDDYSDRIVLSGTNWLTTHWAGVQRQWYETEKQYDISAMFQYPTQKINTEYGYINNQFYDNHRKLLIDSIDKLPYNIAKISNGSRVSLQEYYNYISKSKITLAPYGYGEMAPRDIEAAMFGSILVKPDMSYIETAPDIFINGETYIACKHDYSDIAEILHELLGNYSKYHYIVENARNKILETMHPHNIALNIYNIFKTHILK